MLKQISFVRFIIISFALFISFNSHAQILRIEIKATGLTCSMCSNAIFKQLKSMSEVEQVKTDLNTNTFIVSIKANQLVSPLAFRKKVEDAGFFVGSFVVVAAPEIFQNPNYIVLEGAKKNQAELRFQILDKGYVTDKAFKQLLKQHSKSTSFNAGNENDFHIKMLN